MGRTGLVTSHVGHSYFSSPYSSKSFILRNLLHVPNITKNLINVSQFAKDNDVYFEFHSSLCFVKDMVIWAIVLKGILKDGLHQFHLPKLSFPLNQFFTSLPGYHHIPASSSPTQFSSPSVSRVYTASLCSSSNSNLVHCNQICMSSIGLWHQRLSHPVDKIVKIVLD